MKNLSCLLLAATLAACVPAAARAADPPPAGACPAPSSQPLAFWLGDWDVYADGKLDGHDTIEAQLNGCAIIEHWTDATGYNGMSVFYFEPHGRQWKQVWVTDHALAPGGLKEKVLLASTPDSTRFQGSVWVSADRMVLDRTTLTRLRDGRVSQLIEYSKDGGTTWKTAYDAVYRRAPAHPGPAADHSPSAPTKQD
jgi:hypothetical protein